MKTVSEERKGPGVFIEAGKQRSHLSLWELFGRTELSLISG